MQVAGTFTTTLPAAIAATFSAIRAAARSAIVAAAGVAAAGVVTALRSGCPLRWLIGRAPWAQRLAR